MYESTNKIHNILDSAVSKWGADTACILGHVFISASRQCCEAGPHSFPFFTTLRILFLLVRCTFVVTSAGLWHRLSNNPHLDCPSIQPLCGVLGSSQSLGSGLMCQNSMCQSLVVPPWQRSLTWTLGLKVIRVVGSQLGSASIGSIDSMKKGSHGGQHS